MSIHRPERPFWQEAIARAKLLAFERLPPEHQRAATEAQAKEREARIQALALARRVFHMHDTGHTGAEIGHAVGGSSAAVRRFAAARGVMISRSEKTCRLTVTVTVRCRDALRRLAADYGTTPVKAFEDLALFALEDDAAIARRTLRVERKKGAGR